MALLKLARVPEADRAKPVVMSYRGDDNTFVKKGPLEGEGWDLDKALYGSSAIIRIGFRDEVDQRIDPPGFWANKHITLFDKELEYTHDTVGTWNLRASYSGKTVAEGKIGEDQRTVHPPKLGAPETISGASGTGCGPATPIAPEMKEGTVTPPEPPEKGAPPEEKKYLRPKQPNAPRQVMLSRLPRMALSQLTCKKFILGPLLIKIRMSTEMCCARIGAPPLPFWMWRMPWALTQRRHAKPWIKENSCALRSLIRS